MRYYLSTDTAKGSDTLLTGSRSVGALKSKTSSTGTVTVTVPAAMPVGTYFLLVCADDLNAVTESSEIDTSKRRAGAP